MDRRTFIYILFARGTGLTLDQIERVEEYVKDDAACQTFDDTEIPDLIYMARDVYISRLKDCEDLLEMRNLLKFTIYASNEKSELTDMQVFNVFQDVGRA